MYVLHCYCYVTKYLKISSLCTVSRGRISSHANFLWAFLVENNTESGAVCWVYAVRRTTAWAVAIVVLSKYGPLTVRNVLKIYSFN